VISDSSPPQRRRRAACCVALEALRTRLDLAAVD
jgi:hypothetical protein